MDKQTQDWYDALPPEKKAQYDKLLAQYKAEGGGDQYAADRAYLAVNKPATAQFSGAMANQSSGVKAPQPWESMEPTFSTQTGGITPERQPMNVDVMPAAQTQTPGMQAGGGFNLPDPNKMFGVSEKAGQPVDLSKVGNALGQAAQKVGNFAQDVAGVGQFTGAGMTENVGDARQQIAKQKGFNTWEEYLMSLPKEK